MSNSKPRKTPVSSDSDSDDDAMTFLSCEKKFSCAINPHMISKSGEKENEGTNSNGKSNAISNHDLILSLSRNGGQRKLATPFVVNAKPNLTNPTSTPPRHLQSQPVVKRKLDFVREIQGASSRCTSENSFDTVRDKAIASTSKQNGISRGVSLSVWSDDSDDEAGNKLASYRNIPDSLVPNGPKRSAGRKSGSESKKQRRVSFSSEAKSTQRKRKISSGTPSVNLETRKKMKILRSVETSPSNEDNLDEESKIGEFQMEPELKLEYDQLTNIATNDEPVLEEDFEMPCYETEQSDTDYASLTNSEVQGGSIVLSKGMLKKHIILSEPYHDLKYCMDYPGVYLSFDKRSDEVSVGYITLNPRTIRPFEVAERLGTMVIHVMIGKRVCVKSFRHDVGKKPTLDVQIIPLGGYIVVTTGVPFSVENWSDVHATLFCVFQRQ